MKLELALQIVAVLLSIIGLGWLLASALHHDAYYAAMAAAMFSLAAYVKT